MRRGLIQQAIRDLSRYRLTCYQSASRLAALQGQNRDRVRDRNLLNEWKEKRHD